MQDYDDFDVVEAIMNLEEALGIDFTDEVLKSSHSAAALIVEIGGRLAEKVIFPPLGSRLINRSRFSAS